MIIAIDYSRKEFKCDFQYFENDTHYFVFDGYVASHSRESYQAQIFQAWNNFKFNINQFVAGSYLFVAVEKSSQDVFITHDALGIYQIFIELQLGRLLRISNKLKFWRDNSDYKFNSQYLVDWLALGATISPSTPFRNVERLRAGERLLICHQGKSISKSHWKPTTALIPSDLNQDKVADILIESVNDSLLRHVSSDSQPLFELSGGLDSTTLVSLACAGDYWDQVNTLTWVMEENDSDYKFAKLAAEKLDIVPNYVNVENANRFDFHDALLGTLQDEPGAELAPDARHFITEILKKTNSNAVVSGVGGDNVFGLLGPPPFWAADILKFRGLKSALRLTQPHGLQKLSGRPWFRNFFEYCVRPIVFPRSISFKPNMEFLSRILTSEYYDRCKNIGTIKRPALDGYWIPMYWDGIFRLVGNRAGLDYMNPFITKYPLLDTKVIELGAAIQIQFNQNLEADRFIQRQAFRGIVPNEILNRKDKASSLKTEIFSLTNEVIDKLGDLESCQLVQRGFVRGEQWRAMLTKAQAGYYESIHVFDTLIKMELWLRKVRAI